MTQSKVAERMNQDCMSYTDEEILDIYEKIKSLI